MHFLLCYISSRTERLDVHVNWYTMANEVLHEDHRRSSLRAFWEARIPWAQWVPTLCTIRWQEKSIFVSHPYQEPRIFWDNSAQPRNLYQLITIQSFSLLLSWSSSSSWSSSLQDFVNNRLDMQTIKIPCFPFFFSFATGSAAWWSFRQSRNGRRGWPFTQAWNWSRNSQLSLRRCDFVIKQFLSSMANTDTQYGIIT